MPIRSSILLIDDSPGECELFRMALLQAGVDAILYIEQDAEAALHFLTDEAAHDSRPFVILLDWHLRKTRGDRFLTQLRSDFRFAAIPVVVFTTSDDSSDIAAGYRNGANGYVVKPGLFEELVCCVEDLCRYWLRWNRSLPVSATQC